MGLSGSLDGFELSEILGFVATCRKTGELRVATTRRDGRVWFEDGDVVAARHATADGPGEVVADLLRCQADGRFMFFLDEAAPSPGERRALDEVLAEAAAIVDEWAAIEAVVPSTATRLEVLDAAPSGGVALQAEEWRMVVAAARTGGISVKEAIEVFDWTELTACRTAKVLVDAGLARVVEEAPASQPVWVAPTPAPAASTPITVDRIGDPWPVAAPAASPSPSLEPAPLRVVHNEAPSRPWAPPAPVVPAVAASAPDRVIDLSLPVPVAKASAPAVMAIPDDDESARPSTRDEGPSYGRQALRDVFQLFRS